MEVSGRREYSNKTGKTDILCQPCQGDDETVPAEGYCETCNEFVCTVCIKAHRKLAGTKNHVKSKVEMPTMPISSDPCTELCAVHQSEIVKFYCQQHDCVGCGDRMVLEHKSCKVQLVADVSSYYGNSDELIRIKHSIGHLKMNITSCKHEIERSLKEAEKRKTKVVAEIKSFRNDLNRYLDQVQAEIIKEIEHLSAKDDCQQRKLQDECKSLESEMAEFESNLKQNSEKVNQLFVTSKFIQKRLQKCQEINQDISSKSQINFYEFEPSKDLTALQMKHSPFGKLSTEVKTIAGSHRKSMIEMKTHFMEKVKVQAAKEEKCKITGLARLLVIKSSLLITTIFH